MRSLLLILAEDPDSAGCCSLQGLLVFKLQVVRQGRATFYLFTYELYW